MSKGIRSHLARVWNETGSLNSVARRCGVTVKEARGYLSTRPGWPGRLPQIRDAAGARKALDGLSEDGAAIPQPPAPITLPRVTFLERRFDWEHS